MPVGGPVQSIWNQGFDSAMPQVMPAPMPVGGPAQNVWGGNPPMLNFNPEMNPRFDPRLMNLQNLRAMTY
jgi:hypothetical protein